MPLPQPRILGVNAPDGVLKVFRVLLEEEGYRLATQRSQAKDMAATGRPVTEASLAPSIREAAETARRRSWWSPPGERTVTGRGTS